MCDLHRHLHGPTSCDIYVHRTAIVGMAVEGCIQTTDGAVWDMCSTAIKLYYT